MAILSSNPGGSQVYTMNVKYDFAIARYFMESKIALIFPIFAPTRRSTHGCTSAGKKGAAGKRGPREKGGR
jgi:hypothetical protein